MAQTGEPFSVKVVTTTNGSVRLEVVGEIDMAAAPELFERLHDADQAGDEIVVDLHQASLLDSAGLGVLARVAASGVRLRLVGASGIVRRALDISGLEELPSITVE
jgi:anti-anti-sigma factor